MQNNVLNVSENFRKMAIRSIYSILLFILTYIILIALGIGVVFLCGLAVNAFVFYDSNFWSMFFPVRKNLQIGLGLMNAISATELKAIPAHEFGHFSQRSMNLHCGTYSKESIAVLDQVLK